MPSPTESPLPEIRQALWRLNESLLSEADPCQIEATLAGLEQSAQKLAWISAPDAAVGAELLALRQDLARASRLVESGLALNRSWANVLGSLAGEYTATGEAAALGVAPHIAVKG